jgi:hypothetical protein
MRLEEHPLDEADRKYAHAYVTDSSGMEYVHRMTRGAVKDSGGLLIKAFHISPEDAGKVAALARAGVGKTTPARQNCCIWVE